MLSILNLLIVLAWCAQIDASTNESGSNTTSIPFRIMSLGASVSFGIGSTTGDSYRKDLQDLLVANHNTVEYVGDKKNGQFSNNAVEATPGFVISQIAAAANTSVPKFRPNLVLIDAGTNNCNNGGTVPDAGKNMTDMINKIFKHSPGTTVILTTILVNSIAVQDACRVTVNAQYKELATTMQAAGAKLVLVDMRGPNGPLVTDLADTRHPNDAGYIKMSNVWFQGIQELISKNFLTTPSINSNCSDSKSSHPRPSHSNCSNSTSSSSSTSVSSNSTTSGDAMETHPNATSSAPASSTNSGTRGIQTASLQKILCFSLFVSFMFAIK